MGTGLVPVQEPLKPNDALPFVAIAPFQPVFLTVTVDPAPGLVTYQADDGSPSPTLGKTTATFGQALLHNAVPGPTRISGTTQTGRTFLDVTLDVPAGEFNTLTILRAID